jgi:hypothetical protein
MNKLLFRRLVRVATITEVGPLGTELVPEIGLMWIVTADAFPRCYGLMLRGQVKFGLFCLMTHVAQLISRYDQTNLAVLVQIVCLRMTG